jgi:GT2 family glycosyltransferase
MTSASPAVAVVVVTFNSAELVADLVASLAPGLEGTRWHLIVVDNDSSDGTLNRVRELAPCATVVEMGRNAGYAAGINAGVAASGPYTAVLVLNPDVRLRPGCGAALLRTLAQPSTGIAAPLLVDAKGDRIDSQRREPTILRALGDAIAGAERVGRHPRIGEVVTSPRSYRSPTVVDWAEGSTLLLSADCWARCGPWDESFFLYSEETDFALRARDAGFLTRFDPQAEAVHLEGGSAGTPGLWTLVVMNRVRLYSRRHGRLPTACFWGAVVLRELTRAALGHVTSRRALRGLLSPRRWRERPGPRSIRP